MQRVCSLASFRHLGQKCTLGFVVLCHLGTREGLEAGHLGPRGRSLVNLSPQRLRDYGKETEAGRRGEAQTGRGRQADKQTCGFVLAELLWKAGEDKIGVAWVGGQQADQPEGMGCAELWGHPEGGVCQSGRVEAKEPCGLEKPSLGIGVWEAGSSAQ